MINSNISRINFHIGILFKYLAIIFGRGWGMAKWSHLIIGGREGVCRGPKYDRRIFEQPLTRAVEIKSNQVLSFIQDWYRVFYYKCESQCKICSYFWTAISIVLPALLKLFICYYITFHNSCLDRGICVHFGRTRCTLLRNFCIVSCIQYFQK